MIDIYSSFSLLSSVCWPVPTYYHTTVGYKFEIECGIEESDKFNKGKYDGTSNKNCRKILGNLENLSLEMVNKMNVKHFKKRSARVSIFKE